MSHPSKISEIIEMKESGYTPYLYFVCIDKPEVNISRISNRVVLGEHDVPKDKVIQRYHRSLELLHEVLPLCYRAYLFDNSGKEYELIAEFYKGDLEIKLIICLIGLSNTCCLITNRNPLSCYPLCYSSRTIKKTTSFEVVSVVPLGFEPRTPCL